MPTYIYKGKNKLGETIKGHIEGQSTNVVAQYLLKAGIFPLSIEEKKTSSVRYGKRNDTRDLLIFTRQLHILVRSGVPISRALKSLEVAIQDERMKNLFKDIRQNLDSGHELHITLQRYPQVFSSFYVNMIKIGELTGNLAQVLEELYNHIEFEQEMKTRAKSALRYPVFVMAVMTIAFVVMMTMVVPAFSQIYASFKSQLPWPTQVLIGLSNFMTTYGLHLGILLAGIAYIFLKSIRTGEGRLWWDRRKFDIPIAGTILKKSVLARFARSFSLSIKSGIPVVQTLTLLSQVIDNHYLSKHLDEIRNSIERGNNLYNSMRASGVFEPLVLEMVSTGEEAGELDTMTQEVAHLYDKDIEYELKALSANIEPIMLVLLGVLITLFALGIFLPIWDLSSVVTK